MIIGIDNANNPKRNWGKRKFTPQYAWLFSNTKYTTKSYKQSYDLSLLLISRQFERIYSPSSFLIIDFATTISTSGSILTL